MRHLNLRRTTGGKHPAHFRYCRLGVRLREMLNHGIRERQIKCLPFEWQKPRIAADKINLETGIRKCSFRSHNCAERWIDSNYFPSFARRGNRPASPTASDIQQQPSVALAKWDIRNWIIRE